MNRLKIIFITIFVLSVILIANTYAKTPLIDSILGLFGLSGWTQENRLGTHVSGIILLLSLFVSFLGVKNIYEREGKRVGKKMIILSIVFWIMFPSISKMMMYAIHYNSTSLSSVQVTESTCDFDKEDELVQANCNITVFNFGKYKRIELKPVLESITDEPVNISFDSKTFGISGHSEIHFSGTYTGNFSEEYFPLVFMRDVEFEVALVEND